MASYEIERERFIVAMQAEGMSPQIAKRILRHANTIQRLAALACSSEAADRDKVPCPARGKGERYTGTCLCADYGGEHPEHEMVPRHMVQSARAERLVAEWCVKASSGILVGQAGVDEGRLAFSPVFNGDPRGACTKLRVPSGRTDDWSGEGVCVPTRRY